MPPPSHPPPSFQYLSSRPYIPTELSQDPVTPLPKHKLNRKKSMLSLFRLAKAAGDGTVVSPINQREMAAEGEGWKGEVRVVRSENFLSVPMGQRAGERERERGRDVFVPAYKKPRKHVSLRGLFSSRSFSSSSSSSSSYADGDGETYPRPHEARYRNRLQKRRPLMPRISEMPEKQEVEEVEEKQKTEKQKTEKQEAADVQDDVQREGIEEVISEKKYIKTSESMTAFNDDTAKTGRWERVRGVVGGAGFF